MLSVFPIWGVLCKDYIVNSTEDVSPQDEIRGKVEAIIVQHSLRHAGGNLGLHTQQYVVFNRHAESMQYVDGLFTSDGYPNCELLYRVVLRV